MKLLPAVLTGCLLALPALAIAQDVKIDYDKAYNFAPVKTYTIRIGTPWGNDLSQRRVLEEFDGAIAAKGWKKVNEGQPADIHVVLHGATQTKHNVNTFYSGDMGGYGYRYGGMGSMGTASTTVSEYTVGTLVVDMFDAKTKNLVFRGTAQDETLGQSGEEREKARQSLRKAVQELPADGREVAPLEPQTVAPFTGGRRALWHEGLLG